MSKVRLTSMAVAVVVIGGLIAILMAGGATAAKSHRASPAVLKVATVQIHGVGKHNVLVNASGRPVYLLTGDSKTHPECISSSCLKVWPPVTSSAKKPTAKGVSGVLTVWTHKGLHQVVLNGHPLYTFASDSAHAANGQGFKSAGHVWELLTANGKPFTAKPSSSTNTSTSTSPSTGTSTSPSGAWG